MSKKNIIGGALIALYALTIVLANMAFKTFGVVPVGFGLMAPAAVLVAGFAFIVRDYVHEIFGPIACFGAILLGSLVSVLVDPALAVASAAAFAFSETADLLVFSRLRDRGFKVAVVGSNLVGIVLDSVIFLTIAFGSLAFLPGQIVGKFYATALVVLYWVVVGAARRSRTVAAA